MAVPMKLTIVALLALILAPQVPAQQGPLSETVDVNVVNVDVWVTDKKGQPVWGLEAKDFQLFEDEDKVEIGNFYAETVETRAPRSLIVYVDDTGVPVADRNNVLAALLPFVEERVRRDRTPVLVARFDGRVKGLLVQVFAPGS